MITWGIYSGVSIKSQLKNSRKYSGYYTHTGIDNSFIFGILRPRIFIPASIEKADRTLILKHEQTHLKRGDHIAKIFMYFVLFTFYLNFVTKNLLFSNILENKNDSTLSLISSKSDDLNTISRFV